MGMHWTGSMFAYIYDLICIVMREKLYVFILLYISYVYPMYILVQSADGLQVDSDGLTWVSRFKLKFKDINCGGAIVDSIYVQVQPAAK